MSACVHQKDGDRCPECQAQALAFFTGMVLGAAIALFIAWRVWA